jgi:2-amino-4-hydroxy-6-hydroxymethyldihydropteridine diphosphokinase
MGRVLLTDTQRPEVEAFVALGANLGDAKGAVRDALAQLNSLPGTRLVRQSGLYRTAPWEASGPDFINAVAQLATRLPAPDLLNALQQLELAAGRERPYLNAPRTLDLDILWYGSGRLQSPRLTVPHPRMWQRAFVLVPLAELAPNRVPPAALAAVAGQAIERVSD